MESIKFKQLKRDILKAKKKLIAALRKKGDYENFGQNELRDIRDKYSMFSVTLYEDNGREANELVTKFSEWIDNASVDKLNRGLVSLK